MCIAGEKEALLKRQNECTTIQHPSERKILNQLDLVICIIIHQDYIKTFFHIDSYYINMYKVVKFKRSI